MRQKFFYTPFATSGDKTTVADASQPAGLMSFTDGYTPDYSLEIADPSARKVDRDSLNYLLNVITVALAAIQSVGVPEWITAANNGAVAFPYDKGAHVRYSSDPSTVPFLEYISTVDANTSTPGTNTDWQLALLFTASQAEVLAGTLGTKIVTPSSLSGLFPLKAGGVLNQIPVQTGAGTTGFIAAPAVANKTLTWSGSAFAWANAPIATNIAAGAANQIPVQTGSDTTGFIPAPTVSGTGLQWNGTSLAWVAPAASAAKRLAPNFANSFALIAQRQNAATLTTSRVIGKCDNIGAWASGGAVSAGTIRQRVSNGFACSASLVTLTGSGVVSTSIRMEANDALKYVGKTISVSVKVAHDVGSNINYILALKCPSGSADDFSALSTIATSSPISVATGSGTFTTITFNNISTTATLISFGLELEVRAVCGAVTAKTFDTTEFYVNIEPSASAYDAPCYVDDLARCQRYLPVFTSGVATSFVGMGNITTTGIAKIQYVFVVQPRVPPTGIVAGAASNYSLTSGTTTAALTAIAFDSASLQVGRVTATTASATLLVGGCAEMSLASNLLTLIFTGAEL